MSKAPQLAWHRIKLSPVRILTVVASLAFVVGIGSLSFVHQVNSRVPTALPAELDRYDDIHDAKPLTRGQQLVFDQLVDANVAAGNVDLYFLPGPDARCINPVEQGSIVYRSPSRPGPYQGHGLVMVTITLVDSDSVRVAYFACSS